VSAGRTSLAAAGARAGTLGSVGRQPAGDVRKSAVFYALLLLAIGIALLGLALLLIDTFIAAAPRFGLSLFTDQTGSTPAEAGFQNAIIGTLYVIAGVIALTVPLGVGAAIYLEEYASQARWFNRLIEINIQNLAAVPSIVYGILGLAFIVGGPFGVGEVVIAGSLTLSLLVLPTVIIASREALRAVPSSIRQGSLALGATEWQTIRRQVLPAAVPGIATGVILAISRAFGETAPLLLVGAATFISFNPDGFDSRYTVLPVQIFNYFSRAQDEYIVLAGAGIVVMLLLLLAMNSFAIYIRNRFEQKW
jgi:phosphate transport system permease protein